MVKKAIKYGSYIGESEKYVKYSKNSKFKNR
jgi:hypothetical protein